MKKIKLFVLSIVSLCAIISCSSDDDNEVLSNESLIIGTWTLTDFSIDGSSRINDCTRNDSLIFDVENEVAEIFNDEIDGNCVEISNSTYTYTIKENTLSFNNHDFTILFNGSTLTLTEISIDRIKIETFVRK